MKKICVLITSVFMLFLILLPQKKIQAFDWQIETVDNTAADVGKYTSIAIDSLGNIHISYFDDTNDNLKYAYYDGLSWQLALVDVGGGVNNVGKYGSIAVDSLNRPHISYYDETDDDLKYAYHDGSWQISIADDGGGVNDVGKYASIVVDSLNLPHISYFDETNDDLKYTYHDVSWQTSVADDGGGVNNVGKYNSLKLDSSELPHISYYDDTDDNLKYTYYDGSWQDVVVDSEDDTGRYTSLSLDSLDNPHISYYYFTRGDLKYAYHDGSLWNLAIIDDGGDDFGGGYTSLALDIYDQPQISYIRWVVNWTDGDLKYAYCNDSTWSTEIVDDIGSVGNYSSLALNSSHISYNDSTEGALKYAYADIYSPVTTADPAGATYTEVQTVTLSAVDTESEVDATYYTTDGPAPTTGSSVYSTPLEISETTTLKFFSVDNAGNEESINTEEYIINIPTPTDTTEDYAGGELKIKDIELDKTYHNTKNNTDFYFYRKPTRKFSVRKKLYIKILRKSAYKKAFKRRKAFKTHYKLKLNVGKAKKATWPNVKKRMKYKVALRYTDAQLTKKKSIKEKNLRLYIKDRKKLWRGPYTVYQNKTTNTLKFKIRNYKLTSELASTNRTFSPTFYFRNLKKVRFVIATKKAFKKNYPFNLADQNNYDFE